MPNELDDAIAELRRVTPVNDTWHGWHFNGVPLPHDQHIATILNAVLSGHLIPLDQHNALMAAMVEAAAEVVPQGWCADTTSHKEMDVDLGLAIQSAIRALTPADATAALERLVSRAREEERERLNGLPHAQRILDRNVLQYMEECRPRDYPRHGFAYNLNCFVSGPWVTKDMVRATCRSLTDRGFAFYMRGLFSEDGEPLGAGYGITDAGAYYLASLIALSEPPAIRADVREG